MVFINNLFFDFYHHTELMNILFVTDAWDPQINGVVTATKKTIAHLKDHDVHSTVLHPGMFRTIPLPFYPEIRIALFPKKILRKSILDAHPDAIHIVTEGPLGMATRNFCKQKNIPFTTAYHTHFALYLKKRTFLPESFLFPYLRWFHNASTRTIVSTQTLADTLTALGFHHLAIAPLGVDTKLFSCPTPIIPFPHKRPIFVYLGRIATEKNVTDFLNIKLPGTKILIGDGPDRKRLEKKYPNAIFLGYLKGKDIVEVLCKCDVMVMPSQTETFGLVVLEGLACGLPVAAYPVMGPKDILTSGIDGYLDLDLTQATQQCLSLDRSKCRETALRYDWAKATEIFLSQLTIIRK